MEWTHLACLTAGGFVGVFLMTVWRNERRYREAQRHRDLYREAVILASSYPLDRPLPPANLRIKSGVIPTAEEVLTRPPVSRQPETRESLRG
jgi:hypothetical protein